MTEFHEQKQKKSTYGRIEVNISIKYYVNTSIKYYDFFRKFSEDFIIVKLRIKWMFVLSKTVKSRDFANQFTRFSCM